MAESLLDVFRTEQKYTISVLERERLRGILSGCLTQDKHNGRDGYIVRSLYFDSMYDRDYMDKIGGYEIRRKLRLRIYDPKDSTAKLELKEKQGDFQRKRSLIMKRGDAIDLCAGKTEVLSGYPGDFALEILAMMNEYQYRPKCIVEYDRFAYIEPTNDIRITFDSALRASEVGLDLFENGLKYYPVGTLDSVTMEVKFRGFLFSYMKDLVSLSEKTQVSNSKYCLARMITMGNEV